MSITQSALKRALRRWRRLANGGPGGWWGWRFARWAGCGKRAGPDQLVDVDATGADARAVGHLGGAEVAAASPPGPAAPALFRLPERGRLTGRPAPGDLPGVQPAENVAQARHRAAGERFGGRREHADLHAEPAFAVDAGALPRAAAGRLVNDVLTSAERARGPDHRQHLDEVARQGIPDKMAGPALLLQPLRRRYHGNGPRIRAQRQPDDPRCAALHRSAVGRRSDAPCAWHPCVRHRDLPFPCQDQGAGVRWQARTV